MHAVRCLTPSPKKRKQRDDSETVNLPRNDALIMDAADEPRSAKKTEVRLEMLKMKLRLYLNFHINSTILAYYIKMMIFFLIDNF